MESKALRSKAQSLESKNASRDAGVTGSGYSITQGIEYAKGNSLSRKKRAKKTEDKDRNGQEKRTGRGTAICWGI
jgi:hypothetical protein